MASEIRVALLDVNVLLALFDANHVHHDVAHDWLTEHGDRRWATCPLTENGCVRLAVSLGAEPDRPLMEDLVRRLRVFRGYGQHEFWADDLSVTGQEFEWPRGGLRHHLTDLYLLALAVKHEGTLVTFDQRIRCHAVRGATSAHLAVLAHDDD